MRFRRIAAQPPIVPPFVPSGRIARLEGRGEVFYRHHDGGDPGAPTLLLLHGWTASADVQWFTAYEALGSRYSFLAIDHRGHGRGMRSEVTFTLEDAADDAAALVRHLGLDRVVPVGYSMGGPISMLLWQRHRELVDALVLCATALEWRATRRDRLSWVGLPLLESMMRSRFTRRWGRRMLHRMAHGNPSLEPWLPWLHAETFRGDPTSLVDAGRSLRRYDARPLARTVTVPTGVLHTTEDHLVRHEKQRELAAAVRASVVEVAADHWAPFTHADVFAKSLRQLVDDVVSRLPARV
jgi:3-oxoadipate enol-lactonase